MDQTLLCGRTPSVPCGTLKQKRDSAFSVYLRSFSMLGDRRIQSSTLAAVNVGGRRDRESETSRIFAIVSHRMPRALVTFTMIGDTLHCSRRSMLVNKRQKPQRRY